MNGPTRRGTLSALAALVTAGCLGEGERNPERTTTATTPPGDTTTDGTTTTSGDTTAETTSETATPEASTTEEPTTVEEAHPVPLRVDSEDDTVHTVTLRADPDGEEGWARELELAPYGETTIEDAFPVPEDEVTWAVSGELADGTEATITIETTAIHTLHRVTLQVDADGALDWRRTVH